jgi:hypothetical protein
VIARIPVGGHESTIRSETHIHNQYSHISQANFKFGKHGWALSRLLLMSSAKEIGKHVEWIWCIPPGFMLFQPFLAMTIIDSSFLRDVSERSTHT